MKAAAVPLALVPALAAVQGGFQPDAWVWSGALAAWLAALAAVATAAPGILRTAWTWPAAALFLLAWTALSTVWSVRPAQSILEARRAVVYAAVVLALMLVARAGSTRALALATYAATSGTVLYALAHYLVSPRRRDPFQAYLLSEPLGYANAVGVLAAIAIVLALGVATAERGWIEKTAAATVPPLAAALALTSSDASWLAVGVGMVVTALLAPERGRLTRAVAVVLLPSGATVALAHVSRYAAVTDSPRVGALALAGAAVVAAAATVPLLRLTRVRNVRASRRAVVASLLVLAALGAVAVARAGSTEPRASYWRVAWHDFTAHAVGGSGAGTFGYEWVRHGNPVVYAGALDAHSLYVETAAELGVVGLVLVLAFLLPPILAVRRGSTYVAATAGAYCLFLVHAGLDWDWEMPAVVVAALACGAAVLAAREQREEPLSPRVRTALAAVALVLAGSAIAGAQSHTVPSAKTTRAPQRGALVWGRRLFSTQRYLP